MTTTPSPRPTAPTPADRPAKPRRKGRVWRFLRRTLVVLIALVVLARIALPFVLPPLLDSAVAGMGLTCRYEKLHLSLTTLDVELWHAVLAPADAVDDDGAVPIDARYVDLEYARVDVDVLALFTGTIRVRRAEIDGLDVRLRRLADGSFDIARHFAGDGSAPEPEAPPAPADAPAAEAALDLTIPAIVDAARAQHVRLAITDETVEPARVNTIDVDVRLSDVGSAERPARLWVTAKGGDLLELAAIEGSFETGPRRLDARFSGEIVGLHPAAASTWLGPLGIEADAHALDARFRAVATLEPAPGSELAAQGEVRIEAVELRADGDEQAGLDGVTVRLEDLTTQRVRLPAVAVRGVRGSAETLADGTLLAAGLRIRPVSGDAEEAAAEPVPEPTATPAAAPTPTDAPFRWSLERFRVGDVRLGFVDRSTGTPARFGFELDELLVEHVDPSQPEADTTLAIRAALPGVAASLTVAGTARPFAPRRTVDVEVALTDITLAELRPYLEAAGLRSELESGQLRVAIDAAIGTDADGALRADAAVAGIRFADGEVEHFALERIGVDGVAIAADGRRVAVDSVEIRGMRSAASIDPEGVLRVFGLATVTTPDAPAAPLAEAVAPTDRLRRAAPDARPASGPPPRIEVGQVLLRDVALRFTDASRDTPVEIAPNRIEVDLRELAFGGDPAEYEAASAAVRLALNETDTRNHLAIAGTIATRPGPLHLDADFRLSGDRLSYATIAPYLRDAGLATAFDDGELRGAIRASVRDRDGTLHVAARIADVALTDGSGTELLGLTALALDELQAGGDGVRITGVTIDNPRLAARRDADGAIHALGIVVPPPAAATAEVGPATTPGASETTAAATAPAPAATAGETPAAAGGFRLDRLELTDARIAWSDDALATPVRIALTAGATVADLAPGTPATTTLALELRVDDVVDALRVTGTARLDPAEAGVELTVTGRGVRAGPLAAYLPPTVEVGLTDGRLDLAMSARQRPADGGGDTVEVAVRDLAWRDGESAALLALDELALRAPRVDPAGGQILVEEVALRGLTLGARRTGAERVELLGVAIDASRAPSVATAPAEPPATASTPAPLAAAAAAPEAPPPLPTIRIERLDVGVESFTFVDETVAGSAPLTASLRLTNPEPWRVLEPDPEQLPPLRLEVRGAATPVIAAIGADLTLAPFADDPHAELTVDVRGIRGTGLTEVIPELAATLDGSGLSDGRLQAKLIADLRVRRRSPIDLDLAQGFGMVARVADVTFQAEPDGPVLAGVGEVFADVPRIDRHGGVRVASLEISDLVGRAMRDADGLHALGLTLKTPPPTEAPAEVPAATETATAPPAAPTQPAPVPGPAVAAAPPPEVRIDEFVMRGIDFRFTDRTGSVPTEVPLTGLDIEVQGISNRTGPDARPIRFTVFVEGGGVELPERSQASSLLAGVVGAAGRALVGTEDENRLVTRPLMEEIAVQGQIQLSEPPVGRIRTSVLGLQLGAFRGLVEGSGVQIGDGVFDLGSDVRLLGAGGIDGDATLTFAHLDLSEPPGGPISRYLKLPAPLGSVLYVLQNDRAEQVIPVGFHVDAAGGVSATQIASTAVSALARVVADAVASAPLRVVGGVTDLVGLTGGAAADPAAKAETVTFEPGVVALGADARAAVGRIAREVASDPQLVVVLQHRFGAGDWSQAEKLANPDPETALALANRLRQRRAELVRDRDEQAAVARAHYAVGRDESAAEASRRLRALDGELARTEEALDAVLQLARPNAERRRDRRTLEAALEIADARLATIRRALVDAGVANPDQRIDARRPRPQRDADERDGGGSVDLVPQRRNAQ